MWDSQVTEATSQWGCSLGADMTAVVEEILAEQLLDSYERAAMLAGRLPRAGGRRQPLQCLPEEMLISSADDPVQPESRARFAAHALGCHLAAQAFGTVKRAGV